MGQPQQTRPDLRQRNRNVMMLLVGLVTGMIGLAYASVPLYELFCRVTGFGGTPMRAEEASVVTGTRDMVVTFNGDLAAGMPWHFRPAQNKMTVRTGLTYTATYVAENPTDHVVTGSSTFNVSPDIFGQYFVKVQCFCFERQVLQPGERVEMPVVFYLDPKLEEDPYLRKLTDVTLSYTFFQVENDAADAIGAETAILQAADAGQGDGS